MKSLFRSTNKPAGLLSIAILSACQQNLKFLSILNAALDASGFAQKVLIGSSPAAGADHFRHDLTFLMGCENAGPEVAAADAAIRSTLAQSGTAYQVLYGDADDRLSQALRMVQAELPQPSSLRPRSVDENDASSRTWVWLCDKCSDPQCEHRLLSDLLANRTAEAAARPTED